MRVERKINIYTLVLGAFLVLFNFLIVSDIKAQGPEGLQFLQRVGGRAGYAPATERSVAQIVGNIIYSTLGLLGVIFLALTVYAGFLWLTAGGDESKVEKARSYLKNGVIGLGIVLAAFSITAFVLRALLSAATRAPGAPAQFEEGGYDIFEQNPRQ